MDPAFTHHCECWLLLQYSQLLSSLRPHLRVSPFHFQTLVLTLKVSLLFSVSSFIFLLIFLIHPHSLFIGFILLNNFIRLDLFQNLWLSLALDRDYLRRIYNLIFLVYLNCQNRGHLISLLTNFRNRLFCDSQNSRSVFICKVLKNRIRAQVNIFSFPRVSTILSIWN
jgi:hypothetical protein